MDYNIYIHNATGSNSSSQTKAWTSGNNSQTSSNKGGDAVGNVSNVVTKVSNPDSLVNEGIGALAKKVPWIAVAFVVVSAATKITDEVLTFQTNASGDYSAMRTWGNFKTLLTMPLRPFSSILNAYKVSEQIRLENIKKEQMRLLIGESITNLSEGNY